MNGWRTVTSAIVVTGVAATAIVWALWPSDPSDGPLPAPDGSSTVTYANPTDEALAWSVALPANPTTSDVTITGVTFDAVDITVDRVGLDETDEIGLVIAPDDLMLQPIAGFTLPAKSSPPAAGIVFVVSAAGPRPAIDGVVVTYEADGDDYQWITRQSLMLYEVDPGPEAD